MKYINTLREDEDVRGIYLCKQYQSLKTKAGKSYYSLTLTDKTGTLDAKVWDIGNPGVYDDFNAMDYVNVNGRITSFQGSLQLNITNIRKANEGEYDPADYAPCSSKDIEQMYKEVLGYVNNTKQPYLKALLTEFFINDEKIISAFKKSSAAKSIHHAFIGGLLEHTLSVTGTCKFLAAHYPFLQKDLLISAALLHDIGKIKEISAFPENDYTNEGNLIGHLVIGSEMIAEKVKEIPDFPVELEMELRHCILAHHGELEYGSPKKPALAEAMAIYFADNLDSKMETLNELMLNATKEQGEWLGYQRLFETNIRRTTDWN